MNAARLIIRNTIANTIGRLWHMVAWFFVFPYIVATVGIEATGMWLFITAYATYFLLLHVIISMPLTKKVAEYHTRKEHISLAHTIQGSFTLGWLIGFAAAFILAIMTIFQIWGTAIPQVLHAQARHIMMIVAGIVLISVPTEILGAAVRGLQRYDISNTSEVVASICRIVAIMIALRLGAGIVLIAALMTSEIIIRLIAYIIALKKLIPALCMLPICLYRSSTLPLIHRGIFLIVIAIVTTVIVQTNKILIGVFISIGAIVYYEAAIRIYLALTRIPQVLLSAFFPAASAFDAQEKTALLGDLYIRGTKYALAFFIPIGLFVAVYAPEILTAWMGKSFGEYAYVVRILVVAVFFTVLHSAATQILKGLYKIRLLGIFHTALIITTLFLAILLVQWWGLGGIALAMLIPQALCTFPYIGKTLHLFHTDWHIFFQRGVRAVLPELGISIIVITGSRLWLSITTIPQIIALGMIIALIAGAGFISWGLDNEERVYLVKIIERKKKRIKKNYDDRSNGVSPF